MYSVLEYNLCRLEIIINLLHGDAICNLVTQIGLVPNIVVLP